MKKQETKQREILIKTDGKSINLEKCEASNLELEMILLKIIDKLRQ